MQSYLLSAVEEEDLFLDWTVVQYSKCTHLRRQGRKTKHIMLIKEGLCSVKLVRTSSTNNN